MSEPNYSAQGLLEFLKQSGMTGVINPGTARSRRTAAEQLLTQLTDEEAEDLKTLDVDRLCSRFHKLQGSTIRPETLRLYNTRLKAALTDYFVWLDDPEGFVSVGSEARPARKRDDSGHGRQSVEQRALEGIKLGVPDRPAEILPIAIRSDRVVFIQNLPLDLTAREARKIARVVTALALEETEQEL